MRESPREGGGEGGVVVGSMGVVRPKAKVPVRAEQWAELI